MVEVAEMTRTVDMEEGGDVNTPPLPEEDYMEERKASCLCFWLRCSDDVNNRWLNCCANVWGTLTFIAVILAIAGGLFAKQFVADFIPAVIKKMEVSMDYFNGGGFMPKTGDLVGSVNVEDVLFKNLNFCEEDPEGNKYSFVDAAAYAQPIPPKTKSLKAECKAAEKCDDLKSTDYPDGLLIPKAVTGKDDINLYTNCKDAIKKAEDEQKKAAAAADEQSSGAAASLPKAPVDMSQIKKIESIPVEWIAFGLCVGGGLIVFIALLLFCCELRTQIKSDEKGACCGIMCCICCPFWFLISTVLSVVAVLFFFIQGVVYSQPFEIVGMLAGGGFDTGAILGMVQDMGKQLAATKEEERLCTDPDTFFAISEVNCQSAEKANMFDKIEDIMATLGDEYKGIENCADLSQKCKSLADSLGKVGDVEIKPDEKTTDKINEMCDNLFSVPMGDKLTAECDTFVSAFYFAVSANCMLAFLSLWGILLALWTGCKACCGDKGPRDQLDKDV